MTYTVSTRAVDLVTEFEGSKPRLVAELCEGGKYELGWGSTYHLDGRPVQPGETCTLDYAKQLRAHALQQELKPVLDAVKVPLRQHEVDALASFAYNAGGSAASGSSVVRELNAGRFENAAAAFAMWTGATSSGPSPREIANGYRIEAPYAPINGKNRWIGPDGQPCQYFRRLTGLLRRGHAQGCLLLGYDHSEATKPGALSIRTRLEWNAAKSRWQDVIIEQTPFTSTLAVARKYPLLPAMPPIPQEPDPPKAPAPVVEVKAEPLPELKPAVDPSLPPKKIEESRTGKAVNRASRGRETVAISTIGTVLAGLATQIEIIGRSLENIGTDTMIRVALFGFICLAGMGAYWWWSGRNEAYHRRLETQDPKY